MQIMLVIALILSLALPFLTPSSAKTGANIQPQLLQMAEENPDQTLRLIVQKTENGQMAEALATQLGGEIVADLSMIHAFAVEMAAGDALRLAKSGAVRWVSLDAPVESAGKPPPKDPAPEEDPPAEEPAPQATQNFYHYTTLRGDLTHYTVNGQPLDGAGIGVAIIDSGVDKHSDFGQRVKWQGSFTDLSSNVTDLYGHGTHVAGIIGGDGSLSYGDYAGMAPGADIYGLKIADGGGMAYESDVVSAMQWVYDNKDFYNIRIVNLSLNSTVESSYHNSPMSAAAEILWFNGIVVVASVGNIREGMTYNPTLASPAHDPFIITVGATDEMGSGRTRDDQIATFSAFGTTLDGFTKPDIYAPGKDIVSPLSMKSTWDDLDPSRCQMNCQYFRLSGTSMAAPIVTGTVALLLQDEPGLTPDQVKYRLLDTAGSIKDSNRELWPYLNTYDAVMGTTTESANFGLEASQLLWTGDEPVVWGSVAWNSVAWNSVAWNSVAWNSVAWNSVAWNSVAWNE
jgi:serine protease AprX